MQINFSADTEDFSPKESENKQTKASEVGLKASLNDLTNQYFIGIFRREHFFCDEEEQSGLPS